MLSKLKNHPFGVEAFFEKSIVLTFAVPKEELESYIPECLTLDTYNEKWAFIAIAMVQTKDLRPKRFPKLMGSDFFLIGYRIFVRYTNTKGKNLRGLYILKSETDSKQMAFFGNIFTHYNYTTTDIIESKVGELTLLSSKKSQFSLSFDSSSEDNQLPLDSPFPNWKIARRYAGPLPFTFTYNKRKKEVLIIEGKRQNWKPNPLNVQNYNFDYLTNLNLSQSILANAFIIEQIPYCWEKGKLESWK